MEADLYKDIEDLLQRNNTLLSLKVDYEGKVIHSSQHWKGKISDFITEKSYSELMYANQFSQISIILKPELGEQLFHGRVKKENGYVTFLGNKPNENQIHLIQLDKEGQVLESNHHLFNKGKSYIKNIEDPRTVNKFQRSLKYCLEKNTHTGFEVSDVDNLNSTIYYQFHSNKNGCTLTIEKLSFNEVNSIHSAYFQQILDNSADFIYKSDLEGYFVYTNKTMRDRYGIADVHQIGNMHFTHWIRDDYKELVQRFYIDQIKSKTPVTYLEFPTITNSGEEIWVGQNVQIILSGDWILGIQSTSRDITENKIIEHELIDIQGKNQAILDSIPDSIFVIDNKLKILDKKIVQSAKFLDVEGSMNLKEVIEDKAFLSKLTFSSKIAYEYKTTQKIELILQVNNVNNHFDVSVTNIDEKKTLLIFRNITDSKLHENNLRIAQEKERIALNAKQRYLSFMSHEIRTPLNAIMGLNDLLLDTSPTPKQVEYLKNIKSSSSILFKIINDVLDFNKLESENIQVETRKFNLKKLSKEVINSCLVYSYGKPVELFMDISEDTPIYLEGDSFKLTQILTNLIGNALKFTEKGEVKLSIQALNTNQEKAEIQFVISDTGIGIPEEKLENIFDSYEQVDASISRKFGGTGLGLTITKKFVELLGGGIKVISDPQEGTEFSFTLEFGQTEEVKETKKQRIKADLSTNSILLVEDNEMNQLVMSKYFRKWGINYDIVENGKQALKKLEDFEYQLILLDLEMPVMDGFDTAWHIKNHSNDNINSTPIIAISATMYSEVEDRLNYVGVNDFIPKPFNSEHVYNMLVKYLIKDSSKIEEEIAIDNLLENSQSYDLTYLIESSLNDMNYINKMIELFTTKSPDYLKEMRELYDDSKLNDLKKLAHKYRASVAIMGIKKAENTIIKIENSILEKRDLHRIEVLLDSLEKEVTKACREISANYK